MCQTRVCNLVFKCPLYKITSYVRFCYGSLRNRGRNGLPTIRARNTVPDHRQCPYISAAIASLGSVRLLQDSIPKTGDRRFVVPTEDGLHGATTYSRENFKSYLNFIAQKFSTQAHYT
jgi:hypothetical protein